MASIRDHEAAERDMRRLLDEQGMPQPDEVEHYETSIVLKWEASKTAVIIDLTEPPDR
jgi:hypothetical protein